MKKLSYMALGLIGIMGALSVGVASADTPTVTHSILNVVPETYTLNGNTGFTAGTITVTDGTTTITILDRNLGATAAGTGCEDRDYVNHPYSPICNGDNTYGYLFQWGNNYGFPSHGELSNMSSTSVSSPNIPYTGSTFITGHNNWMDDNNVVNLWGGTTNEIGTPFTELTQESAIGRRGPCPDGWHVPSVGELNKLLSMFDNKADIHEKLLIPFAGYRKGEDGSLVTQGYWIGLMSSSINPNQKINYNLLVVTINNGVQSYMHSNSRSTAQSVRCFYNQYTEYGATLPSQISSISITGITLPVGGATPTLVGIASQTTGINISNRNTIGNMNYDMVRCSVGTNPELCGIELTSFVAGTKYNLYVPFTVDSGYALANSFTATDGTNNAIETDGDIKRVVFQYTATAPAAYTIRWLNYNGDALETDENVAEGTTPTYDGATPTKPEDSSYTYTFDKWTPDVVPATATTDYTATFTATAKQTSTSSSGGGGHGKTVAKTDTKTDETKAEETKQNENKSENNENNQELNIPERTQEELQKVLDDGLTQEFHDAYDFGFHYGITTMDSIEKADMNGPLTRIAMAKMLSNYAINVLGKKPANKIVPKFPDVDEKLNEDYGGAVDLAYQLGIMGIGIEDFRPFDLVPRGEFGTALSRMLYGTPDGEGAFYETHLKKLKEMGIITNDDPFLMEIRGYTFTQLMRSAK